VIKYIFEILFKLISRNNLLVRFVLGRFFTIQPIGKYFYIHLFVKINGAIKQTGKDDLSNSFRRK